MTHLPPLTVIEASAGTGKTYSLVTRLMALIFSGVEPERIVALTFSRMAAGEIFNSFIGRLSRAASSDEAARRESENLPPGRAAGRKEFAAMLRKVVSRQHLSLVGTLDSFLVRMVRMAPAELGFEGDLEIMGEYRDPVERVRLAGEMMSRAGDAAKSIFREAFRLVNGTSGARTFVEDYAAFIDSWRGLYLEYPDAASWGGADRIWGGSPPEHLDASVASVRAMAAGFPATGKTGAAFAAKIASFSGAKMPKVPKLLRGEEAAAARAIADRARGFMISRAVSRTQGVYLLMRAYDAAYARMMRETGLVGFADLPRLVAGLSASARLDLEYRMDSRFDHWELDEFQDTSREQWSAIRGIMDESGSGREEKSVFIVGDRKQSIYDWRGGDVRILSGEAEKARRPPNLLLGLNESRRFGSEISAAVNRVFGERFVERELDCEDAPERKRWRFADHSSVEGAPRGFVEVLQAERSGAAVSISNFFAPVENALKAVRPWEKGISAAILVRSRKAGLEMLSHLKEHGVPRIVFEGDGSIMDSPVLDAMVAMVRLAENAGDAYSYARIRFSPLADAMFPGGLPDAPALSARFLSDFSRRGLIRVFRDAREALKRVPGTWNGFTESRFEDFVKCAAEFEDARTASMRLSDFADFAAGRTRRDFAEPDAVRIMTIHQSKGLGFDWCIVPVYEHSSLASVARVEVLENESPSWLLANPGSAVNSGDPMLAAAERAAACSCAYDELCVWYVAMTRAKKALTLVLHPMGAKKAERIESGEAAEGPAERFSDLVRRSGLETHGDREWHLSAKAAEAPAAGRRVAGCAERKRREQVARRRPGELFRSGIAGDELFSAGFGSAAGRGIEAHSRYEAIEWLDASQAATDFERALAKPSPDATLWREKPYEIFCGGRWESGRFDRVVFTGSGASRRATVYDFKTNALRPGETAEAFAERLRATYAGQMRSYREALSRLASIPPENIETVLLASAVSAAIPVPRQAPLRQNPAQSGA